MSNREKAKPARASDDMLHLRARVDARGAVVLNNGVIEHRSDPQRPAQKSPTIWRDSACFQRDATDVPNPSPSRCFATGPSLSRKGRGVNGDSDTAS